VSACKLFASGKASATASDKQLRRMIQDGPVCQVMSESLWKNEEGMSASQLRRAHVGWWLAPSLCTYVWRYALRT
jgi:hypothetical protein